MDASVYKKLMDIESQKENPFHNATGQDVVSISESFWARMNRVGRYRSNHADKQAFATTTAWNWGWSMATEAGMRMYPKKIIISADVDCELGVQIKTGLTNLGGQNVEVYPTFVAYVKAGTPFVLDFDGDIYCNDAKTADYPGIFIGVNNTSAAGNLYYTIHAMEVAYND